MPFQRDPDALEVHHLHHLLDLSTAHILEIGCGNGYLTGQYAPSARRVCGVDANTELLAAARRDYPRHLQACLTFVQTAAEALPFPSETFDVALFTSSL